MRPTVIFIPDRTPRRTRFRLWWHHRIDLAACWLVNHGHTDAAILLWRIFRMW